jgi:hypothetical protein
MWSNPDMAPIFSAPEYVAVYGGWQLIGILYDREFSSRAVTGTI